MLRQSEVFLSTLPVTESVWKGNRVTVNLKTYWSILVEFDWVGIYFVCGFPHPYKIYRVRRRFHLRSCKFPDIWRNLEANFENLDQE